MGHMPTRRTGHSSFSTSRLQTPLHPCSLMHSLSMRIAQSLQSNPYSTCSTLCVLRRIQQRHGELCHYFGFDLNDNLSTKSKLELNHYCPINFRGGWVKALAICTRHPFINIFKVREPTRFNLNFAGRLILACHPLSQTNSML